MRVTIEPEAEEDIFEAYRWYEDCDIGLGEEFLRAIDGCIASIQRYPLSYAIVYKAVRRALTRKFPYGIFYYVDNDNIVILACFHASRNPKRLKDRL